MEKNKKSLVIVLWIMIFIVSLACTPVEIDKMKCTFTGGRWVKAHVEGSDEEFINCVRDGRQIGDYTKDTGAELSETIGDMTDDQENANSDSDENDASQPEPDPDEGEEASEYTIDACIAEFGSYHFLFIDPESGTGTGGTTCQYYFTVKNVSEEGQHLIYFETFDNNEMQSEQWKVRGLSAGDLAEFNCSYTKYNDGVVTFSYPTKVLVMRGIRQCYWLTRANLPGNEDLWEEHAMPLENSCR